MPGDETLDNQEVEDPNEEQKEKQALPDPLSTLTLNDLLKHPTLGPQVHSWADRGAVAQVRSAKQQALAEARADAEIEALSRRFDTMSPEELGQALTDPKTAEAYANLIQRNTKLKEGASQEEINRAGQVYGYAVQVATYMEVLEESGLTADVKASLSPDNFTHLGPKGITEWGKAIHKALVEHESSKGVDALLEARWEAYKEERLAELDGGRVPADVSNGRPSGPVTGEMLRKMSPQEIMQVPKDQRNKALKTYTKKT